MFLISDLEVLNIPIIKELFRKNDIHPFSKLKKIELFNKINVYFATRIIQRVFRKHFYKNAVDHITLEHVEYPCFIFCTKPGKHYFYEYDSIIKYIMKSGNVKDPMTRIEYSDDDLIRLDSEAKIHFPDREYKSTLKIKKNPVYARRIRNRENEILSFQLRLSEIKNAVLIAIESDICSWELLPEPIIIDLSEYQSVNSYLNSLVYELKLILSHLSIPDQNIFMFDLNQEIGDEITNTTSIKIKLMII